jgi:hypothetical protein
LDEAHSSPGLQAAAGLGLAEECATLVTLEFRMVILLSNFVDQMGIESELLVCGRCAGWVPNGDGEDDECL